MQKLGNKTHVECNLLDSRRLILWNLKIMTDRNPKSAVLTTLRKIIPISIPQKFLSLLLWAYQSKFWGQKLYVLANSYCNVQNFTDFALVAHNTGHYLRLFIKKIPANAGTSILFKSTFHHSFIATTRSLSAPRLLYWLLVHSKKYKALLYDDHNTI